MFLSFGSAIFATAHGFLLALAIHQSAIATIKFFHCVLKRNSVVHQKNPLLCCFFYPLFSVKMSSRSAKAVSAVLIPSAAAGLALTSIFHFWTLQSPRRKLTEDDCRIVRIDWKEGRVSGNLGEKNSNLVAVRARSLCYAQYVPLPHPHNHINPERFFSECKVSPPLMLEFIVAFIYTAGLSFISFC